MPVGVLTLRLRLPGCDSLKAKRSRLKPLLARLHRQFNVSAAEMDNQDSWGQAVIACAAVSNDRAQVQRLLQQVARWVDENWPDVQLIEDQLEII